MTAPLIPITDSSTLHRLQHLLQSLYKLDIRYNVEHFLITDRDPLTRVTGVSTSDECVLVRQTDDALELSVYFDHDLLRRLNAADPFTALDSSNLQDFCIALEGISHFLYLIWRAAHQRQTTQLELELQAEIDKYLAATSLMAAQSERSNAYGLHRSLFENVRFRPSLDATSLDRYRSANHYAGKYCRYIEDNYSLDRWPDKALCSELYYFYRLPQTEKIGRINRAA